MIFLFKDSKGFYHEEFIGHHIPLGYHIEVTPIKGFIQYDEELQHCLGWTDIEDLEHSAKLHCYWPLSVGSWSKPLRSIVMCQDSFQ